MRPLAFAALALFVAGPAVAQTERLPLQSRSERQVQDINRSLNTQQQEIRQTQQNQFEINQLRNELSRPPVGTGPGVHPGCPIGAAGC